MRGKDIDMKMHKTHKKLQKYLNLLVDGKSVGFFIVGILNKKKDYLNTFGMVIGDIRPDSILQGVAGFVKELPISNGNHTFLVDKNFNMDEPTETSNT